MPLAGLWSLRVWCENRRCDFFRRDTPPPPPFASVRATVSSPSILPSFPCFLPFLPSFSSHRCVRTAPPPTPLVLASAMRLLVLCRLLSYLYSHKLARHCHHLHRRRRCCCGDCCCCLSENGVLGRYLRAKPYLEFSRSREPRLQYCLSAWLLTFSRVATTHVDCSSRARR